MRGVDSIQDDGGNQHLRGSGATSQGLKNSWRGNEAGKDEPTTEKRQVLCGDAFQSAFRKLKK